MDASHKALGCILTLGGKKNKQVLKFDIFCFVRDCQILECRKSSSGYSNIFLGQ